MAAAGFRQPGGAGAHRTRAAPRAGREAAAPCLPFHRHARRGQDHARAHPGEVPQLRDRHHPAAVREVLRLRGDRRRPLRRPAGSRRRHQYEGGRDAPAPRDGAVRPHAGSLQGLRDRRSAHALDLGIQRDAEDAGRAAGAHEVHPGDHRPAEDPGHRSLALPAVQPEADAAGGDRLAPRAHPGRGKGRVRGRGARHPRARRLGQHARRAIASRPGDRARRRQGGRGAA